MQNGHLESFKAESRGWEKRGEWREAEGGGGGGESLVSL